MRTIASFTPTRSRGSNGRSSSAATDGIEIGLSWFISPPSHDRRDEPLQQDEPERAEHADGRHAEERGRSPLLREHPRQREPADDERKGDTDVDQTVGL